MVAIASSLPVISVRLEEIREIDGNFWFQGEGDTPTCRSMVDHFRLMNETDLSYPIILSNEGRVMDVLSGKCFAL